MNNLLRIDASSRLEGSHSRELGEFFTNVWLQHNKDGKVTHRDLVKSPLPHINEETITGFYTPLTEHTSILKDATKTSDELIYELMNSDTVLITTPMYNFSAPSSLKAWIDQIVRIGRTFNFSPETGFEGLLRNKKVYVLTATGAVFSNEGMQELDFLTPYLKSLFGFLGITTFQVIPIQGTTTDESELKQSKDLAEKTILELGDNL